MAAPILLCDCEGMPRDRWLECRDHGPKGDIEYTVGGSDVSTIFGVNPWVTPLELWMQKKGRMKRSDPKNQNQLDMGHMMEPIAAHFYGIVTGNKVVPDTNMYQHADFPYALADFDYRFEDTDSGEPGILECKNPTFYKRDDWADGRYPLYYELQLRYYMAVAAVQIGDFAAIWGNNPDNDLATPRLLRDRAKEDMIFERLDQWIWSLKRDKPPTMTDVAPTLAMESLSRIYGASQAGLPTIEFPAKYERSLRQIAELQGINSKLRSQITTNEEAITAHSVRIAELMKNHEHGVLATTTDKLLVDFVTRTTRRVNSDRLKKEHPSIYADVLNVSESRKVKVSIQPA